MLNPQALPDIFESAADRESGRCQDCAFELRPKTFAQNRADIDWSSLQKNVLPSAIGARALRGFCVIPGAGACPERSRRVPLWWSRSSPSTATFDPKDSIAIVRLHGKSELHLKFLRAPHKI